MGMLGSMDLMKPMEVAGKPQKAVDMHRKQGPHTSV